MKSSPEDICANNHSRADTSKLAFASTSRKTRAKHRMMILVALDVNPGQTCEELEDFLKMKHQTCSARISELLKDEKIVDTGERKLTRSGKKARVYKTNDKASI